MKRTRVFLLLICICFVLLVGCIFLNSMQTSALSNAQSERIVAAIQPVIESLLEKLHIDVTIKWNFWVRKIAHCIEYTALGSCIGGGMLYAYIRSKRVYFGGAAFVALLIGVIDEYIQSFTGRTSQVQDVMIDLLGSMLGILLSVAIYAVVRRRKNKRMPMDPDGKNARP